MSSIQNISEAIATEGFSKRVLHNIDEYVNDIQNGTEDFPRFNLSEHAGLSKGGAPLIGASIVACYATASLTASRNAEGSQGSPANWEIDELQERLIEQWARAANLWEDNSEQILTAEFGPMIAQGAEAKVYYRDGDGLMRIVLTQPYVNCKRLATKEEIDEMVASKGFQDNWNGQGVNYISSRLALEDMHPANVFIDVITEKPICIDCIVKFV
ncbi:MAG: hypothetical protein IJV20_00090 [Prevotella sp.]|nr:hypothetical protein [Prevotella sp.]